MATYIPDSYLRAEAALNNITEDVSNKVRQVEQAIARLVALESELNKLSQTAPNGWAGLVQYVDDQVTANPSDEAWLSLKGRMDKIVADFQARKTELAAINAAIAAV